MRKPYPSNAAVHRFFYPHADSNCFIKIAQAVNKYNYDNIWCLWRSKAPDGTYLFNQVVGTNYVTIPEYQLRNEITTAFNNKWINYIVPVGSYRVYASFDTEDQMYRPFDIIIDAITVIHNYQIWDYKDDWGLFHDYD